MVLAQRYVPHYEKIMANRTVMYCMVKNSSSVVLLLHGGYPSSRATRGFLVDYGRIFNTTVCGVDYSLSGFGGKEVEDVVNAVRFWKKKGKRVAVLGKSHGGYLALLAATMEKCDAVVSIAGPTDLLSMGEFSLERPELPLAFSPLMALTVRECGGIPEENPGCYMQRSPFYRASFIKCPVLLIHGIQDDVVPVTQAYEMEGALEASGKTYEVLYVNGTHLEIEKKEKVVEKVCEFMQKYVGEACESD